MVQQLVTRLRSAPMVSAASVQHLTAGAPGVLRGGVEQDADVAARIRDVAVAQPVDARRPRSAGVSPQIIRRVVDLPAPLGPRNPVTVPGSQRKETSATAGWSP